MSQQVCEQASRARRQLQRATHPRDVHKKLWSPGPISTCAGAYLRHIKIRSAPRARAAKSIATLAARSRVHAAGSRHARHARRLVASRRGAATSQVRCLHHHRSRRRVDACRARRHAAEHSNAQQRKKIKNPQLSIQWYPPRGVPPTRYPAKGGPKAFHKHPSRATVTVSSTLATQGHGW